MRILGFRKKINCNLHDCTQDSGAALINLMFLFNEVMPLACCAVLQLEKLYPAEVRSAKTRTAQCCVLTSSKALEARSWPQLFRAHLFLKVQV